MAAVGRDLAIACLILVAAAPARAQDPPRRERIVDIELTPTGRAQIAVWIESEDGALFETLALTQATAYRGIGNRPGAFAMNSGFRWPYGRREGVLPVWAYRRGSAPGASLFPRVIFQDRASEGFASRTSNDHSTDDYFCLSFDASTTTRDALDAVSCASIFNSDKGRYVTPADVEAGYAEPFEHGTTVEMRGLPLESPYPPRRDVAWCAPPACYDHSDVGRFADDARRVMPNIDAVTMATPMGDTLRRITFDVPAEWPDGAYAAYVEVNVEGDYNATFNDTTYPTPQGPAGGWDYWALNYGYPYRGQPSVVYSVPFTIGPGGGAFSDARPLGYGALDGHDGAMSPMGPSISDDPTGAPGSGADRLRRMADGSRVRVSVVATNVCTSEDPPLECGTECDAEHPCAEGFLCGPDLSCVGYCDLDMAPDSVVDLSLSEHPNEKHSHQWAVLRFVVPESVRGVARYDVRFSGEPIVDDDSFMRAQPAFAAEIDTVELRVPVEGEAGDPVEVEIGNLAPQSQYWVGVRAVDRCNDASPLAVSEVTTTEIHFTTVSPCFIATAAWGTPLAEEVSTLRRFRDRHLATNAAGQTLIDVYYTVGPHLADAIRESDLARATVRTALAPLVRLATWLDHE